MRVYPELTVDGEFKALGDLGFTGALNDRQYSALGAMGYRGSSLTDRFKEKSGFSPTSLFTTVGSRGFFYDFSDYTTQFTDTAGTTAITGTGVLLARINDKSGLGNNATQATPDSRPLTTTIGSVYRGVQFDGIDDWLQTTAIDFSNSDKMTVVAGVRKLSDAARGVLVELGAPAAAGSFRIEAPGSSLNNYAMASGGSTIVGTTAAGFSSPISSILSGLGNISGDSVILRHNGTQVASSPSDQGTGNYANDIIYIGRRGGTTLPFNGIITFLCVINRTLTAGELAQLEAFANGKTGAY